MSILVVAEVARGAPTVQTLELIGLARGLAGDGAVVAIALGADAAAAARELGAAGADRVFVVADPAFDGFASDPWTAAIAAVAREEAPEAILAGHTTTGADLAPRLAFRLGGAAATGCLDAAREDGRLVFTRSCFGGNAREAVSFRAAPAVATFRAGVAEAPVRDGNRAFETIASRPPPARVRSRVLERQRETEAAVRLEDAPVVVAGGRGLNGAEGFRLLEALADVLGGAVGASRVACDLGWCPHSWQIGLTGKTVTPSLYFAVGISGASHHMAGCGRAKTIVAINSDPDAAIFRYARFGVVGDAVRVVPALTDALAGLKSQRSVESPASR